MKLTVKRFMGFSLATILAVTGFAGCTSGKKEDGGAEGEAASGMGRYLEEETNLPEGLAGMIDLVKLEDGRLRMLGWKEPGDFYLWDSADEGDSWEEAAMLPDDLVGGKSDVWIGQGALSPQGDGFLMGYAQEDGSSCYYHMTEQGELTEVSVDLGMMDFADEMTGSAYSDETENTGIEFNDEDGAVFSGSIMENMENNLLEIKYSETGKLFGNDYNGKIHRINPETGEMEADFGNMVQEFSIAGERLITVDYSGNINFYDTETGEPAEQDELLAEGMKENESGDSFDTVIMTGKTSALFHTGNEENTLYYCNRSGLYRCMLGGSVREQLIEGSLNSFGSPDVSLYSMVPLDSGAFLIAILQSEENVSLLKYTYSKDTPSRPSKELKVYALEDNSMLRQAISMFQKENGDYYVSLEVGMTGEDGVTVSDALKTLNTDIMAGKGPDVLILDGMPVQSYMEKGILADLSDIAEELKAGEGCFENIVDTYTEDGKLYAIPLRFAIPVLQSDRDTVSAASELEAFADRVEQLSKDNPDMSGIMGTDPPEILAEKIYQSYSPMLLKEDGSLDEEKIREFYYQLKRIYDAGGFKEAGDDAVSYSVVTAGAGDSSDSQGFSLNLLDLVGGASKAVMGSMTSIMDYCQILAINEKLDHMDWGLLQMAGKQVYCPLSTLGINSKSSQIDSARKFVRYLLGKEAQSLSMGNGYPVNRAAFDASTINTNDSDDEAVMGLISTDTLTGEFVELDVYWPEESDFEKLKEVIEGLEIPILTDDTIWSAVQEQAVKCLNGEISPDEAADVLISKMKLYLAE